MKNIICNLCKENDYTVVYEKTPDREDVDINAKYSAAKGVLCTDQVVICNKCGLVYINPRLEENTITDAVSAGDDTFYVSQREGRIETFQRGIELVETFSPKGKILDVGCAAGFFLTNAKERGWETQGVEPNTYLAEYGKKEFGLNVFNGTLKNAKFPDNYFDVVTMWDVLEHTTDPLSELHEANRILKKGGVLVVNFPDFSSIWAKIFRRKWWFLLSHHLYYFTPKTLRLMLDKAGFEVIDQRAHAQKLKIGYMIDMIDRLSKDFISQTIYKISKFFVKLLHLENVQVSYYLSQTNMISRKK
jgi:2-polyprenyl-3-methyl-5-hydroxy-6-metoxy-1,4-benzoquinol methylase